MILSAIVVAAIVAGLGYLYNNTPKWLSEAANASSYAINR